MEIHEYDISLGLTYPIPLSDVQHLVLKECPLGRGIS